MNQMSIKYLKSVCLESMVFNIKFIKAEWMENKIPAV